MLWTNAVATWKQVLGGAEYFIQILRKASPKILRLACDHRVKLETSFVTVAIDPQYPQLQFFRNILMPVPAVPLHFSGSYKCVCVCELTI